MKRRITLAAAVLLAVISLTACGKAEPSSADESSAASGSVTSSAETTSAPDESTPAESETSAASETPVTEEAPEQTPQTADFEFEHSDELGGAVITKYNGTDADVTIPDTLNGEPVVAIGEEAFGDNKTITSVVIPEGVTELQTGAFLGCRSLTSVSIPSTLAIIGDRSFMDTACTEIVLSDNITYLGSSAFEYCPSLKSVTIGKGITTLNDRTFADCSNLEDIFIPDTVTSAIGHPISPKSVNMSATYKGKTYTLYDMLALYDAINGVTTHDAF